MSEHLDQTKFGETETIYEGLTPDPTLEPEIKPEIQDLKKKKQKKMAVIAALAGGLTVVLLLLLTQGGKSTSRLQVKPTAVPLPSSPPTREFEGLFEDLEQKIEDSDPSRIDLSPPPLGYKLRL